MNLNYQQAVDLVVSILSVATPISLIFAISGKSVKMFIGFVAGEERIKL